MNVVDAQPNDDISHPAHYTHSAIECIEVTEQLSYNLGNAVKYVWRHKHKGAPAKDLRKAAWYLRREAERCKQLWLGARMWYWWKMQVIWHRYGGKIPRDAEIVLGAGCGGTFEAEAIWFEGVATTHE